ncbi:MAG: PA0069 family radical SAM protein [Marinicaulis sp.]|nr:PA0069 family radical SAM protein [Marinicaulis sp.]
MARAAHLSLVPPRPGGNGPPTTRGKGRGAGSNASGRYEKERREEIDDGWGMGAGPEFAPEFDGGLSDNSEAEDCISLRTPLRTDVTIERPRKIITYNNSPYVGFDRSINPYRGCEHGCIYCFARPTHAYMGLSAGLDFESKLFAKPDARGLLERELSKQNYKVKPIAMGTNTDPYQPIEKKFRVMRGILTVFDAFNHPVTVLTKAHLITRDIDLLAPLAERNLTRAMISITTLDKSLARHMEPRAASPKRRLDAVRELADAGIPVGVMTAPMIPGLNDDEMETLLGEAKDAGASFAGYTIIRLPLEVSPLFQEWLETYAPNRAKRVMRHIREMNGGKDYDPQWSRGKAVKGTYAKLIAHRFTKAASKVDLAWENKTPLDVTQFRVPASITGQMNLFA